MGTIKFDFSGENYAITGASSGIGRQIALELSQAGAKVLAMGRNEERLNSLKNEGGGKIFIKSFDICESVYLENAISDFVNQHGKLNGGVHAAGISDITPFRNYDNEIVKKIMDVNFWAGMNLLKLITRSKFGESGTSTVLLSSVAAISPAKGMFAYSASKAAIDSAIRSISREIASKRHRVNSVLPGWVISPMTDKLGASSDLQSILAKYSLGAGKVEDISSLVLFLLSSASNWITGSNFVIDGGWG